MERHVAYIRGHRNPHIAPLPVRPAVLAAEQDEIGIELILGDDIEAAWIVRVHPTDVEREPDRPVGGGQLPGHPLIDALVEPGGRRSCVNDRGVTSCRRQFHFSSPQRQRLPTSGRGRRGIQTGRENHRKKNEPAGKARFDHDVTPSEREPAIDTKQVGPASMLVPTTAAAPNGRSRPARRPRRTKNRTRRPGHPWRKLMAHVPSYSSTRSRYSPCPAVPAYRTPASRGS